MGIFDKVKKTTINSRRYEEKLYEVALEEVESGEIRKGLYAKALSKADGDKEKADGIYLKLRVQSILDDIESEQINSREDARAYEVIQELKEFDSINQKKETKEERHIINAQKQKWENWHATYSGKIQQKFNATEKTIINGLISKAQFEIDSLQVDTKIWADAKGVEMLKGHNAAITFYIEKRVQALLNA
jgi:hypothetical protein